MLCSARTGQGLGRHHLGARILWNAVLAPCHDCYAILAFFPSACNLFYWGFCNCEQAARVVLLFFRLWGGFLSFFYLFSYIMFSCLHFIFGSYSSGRLRLGFPHAYFDWRFFFAFLGVIFFSPLVFRVSQKLSLQRIISLIEKWYRVARVVHIRTSPPF